MERRRPLAGTTIAAAVLHLVMTAGAAAFGALAVFFIGLLGAGFAKNEHDRRQANTFLSAGLVVLVVVAVALVALGYFFLRRRPWARWTLIVMYGLSAVWAVASLVGALLLHRTPVVSVVYILPVLALALLVHPKTAEDFTSDPTPAGPPLADWYPDPEDAHNLRYWNGNAWTGHVSPRV